MRYVCFSYSISLFAVGIEPLKYEFSIYLNQIIFPIIIQMIKNQLDKYAIFLLEQPDDVVSVGQNHQSKHQKQADGLGNFHKLIAWLAACNHFIKQE